MLTIAVCKISKASLLIKKIIFCAIYSTDLPFFNPIIGLILFYYKKSTKSIVFYLFLIKNV